MTPIIAAPSAPYATLRFNAVAIGCSQWYLNALVALWDAGVRTGVDPAVLAGQCAHETGWGKFGGAVTPQHGNTAGIKIVNPELYTNPSEQHARFAMDPSGIPWQGALAHAHHLRLYAGLPVPADTPDPRAVHVWPGKSGFGSAPYVEDLGGKWAPASDYGTRVADVIRRLVGGT